MVEDSEVGVCLLSWGIEKRRRLIRPTLSQPDFLECNGANPGSTFSYVVPTSLSDREVVVNHA